jgi:hypothetical protein
MYYFDGQAMHNYEVNYFFTGYAAGARGYGDNFAQGMARSWNAAKGAKEALTGDGLGRLASTLDPGEIRASMMDKGAIDGEYEHNMGESKPSDIDPGVDFSREYDNKVVANFGEWWPVINPETGEKGYEFFPYKKIRSEHVMAFRRYVKENCQEGGTLNPPINPLSGLSAAISILLPEDPNEIIGPDGQTVKKWVSVKDRMPYTILFENDSSATAPARYIRITTPIEPKQDPATLELGSFGFNNQSFEIPAGTASYYTRLDVRDSTGLFVDVVAGYDQINNIVFWEFQGIDPITLLPPEDPLVGFLFLQDSTQPDYGNGFVNFSIKPISSANTLDTIGAKAFIVFDSNDTIPTNIHTNTIDALAPTSDITALPASTINTEIMLNYTGTDDPGGSGIKSYSIYVKDNNGPPELYVSNFMGTDTTFIGVAEHSYKFYISATDTAGNIEILRLVDSVNVLLGQQIICPGGSTTFGAKFTGSSYQWQVDIGSGFNNISDGGVYSGTNGFTLSVNNASSTMYGYQFRCLINGNSFSDTYLLKFGMTWEGTVDASWENPANWSCGLLPDANTDVLIDGGKGIYPQINSNVTIRTLRMNPGTSATLNTGFQLNLLK